MTKADNKGMDTMTDELFSALTPRRSADPYPYSIGDRVLYRDPSGHIDGTLYLVVGVDTGRVQIRSLADSRETPVWLELKSVRAASR